MYDSYADLYAIIKTSEKLEKAFIRDAIAADEYENACSKLIQQFRVLRGSLKDEVPDVERFMVDYNMQCPAAAFRLLRSGLPATIEHKTQSSRSSDPESVAVAEVVALFITILDSCKLGMVAVDQIAPLLQDCMTSMGKLNSLPPNFQPRDTVKEWYTRLYGKAANFELGEDDNRQLSYELERAYTEFLLALKGGAQRR
ncbi:MAG: hypothetical protein WDW38_011421 [Sanguina aurantia]